MAGLGALFARGAAGRAAAGAVGADVLGETLDLLKSRGIPDKDIAKVLPSVLKSASASSGGSQSIWRAAIATGLLTNLLPSAASKVTGLLTSEPQLGSGVSDPDSRYLIGGQFDLNYIPYYRGELLRRAALSKIPFIGEDLVAQMPPLETPAEAASRAQSRQSQAMEEATGREIRVAQARGLLEQELQRIRETAATERQQISSLADVQGKRVEASYGMAKDLLGNTVSSILGTIPTGRATEVELARIM